MFVKVGEGEGNGKLKETMYRMDKVENNLLKNFLFVRNNGLLFNKTNVDKNGKATINGYITEGNVVSLYYINSDGLDVKFYNDKNGYMAAIWRKDRSAI